MPESKLTPGDPEGGVVVVITFDEQGNPYVGSETYFAPDSNALDPTTVDVTVLGHGYAPPTRDFLDQWSGISRWSRRLYSDGNALGGATTVNLMLDIIHKTPAFLPPGLAGGGGGQGPGGPKPQRAPCVSLRRVRVCFCFSAHPFWRMPWPLHELLPRRGRAKRGASPAPGLADALGVPVQGLCDLGGEWILDQQFWDLYETDTVYPKGFPVADDCPDR